MTRARLLAVPALLGLVLLGPGTPSASAAEPSEGWSVSGWSAPAGTSSGPVTVSGTIRYDGVRQLGRITEVTLQLTRTAPLNGCPELVLSDPQPAHPDDDDPESTPDTTQPSAGRTFVFSITVEPRCNGTYRAAVVALLDDLSGPDGETDPSSDDYTTPAPIPQVDEEGEPVVHVVAAPPGDVAAVISQVAGRSVRLAWQPPSGYGPPATTCTGQTPDAPPDFTGYLVQRESAAGTWTTLPNGEVPAGTQCLEHQEAAEVPSGTNVRYRVLAVRAGPNGAVTAAGGSSAITTAVVDPPPPSTTSTTARPVRTPGTSRVATGGRGGAGPTPPTDAPTTIPDGTYEEELDYGEPGEEAAVLPDDADTFLDFVPSPGPGILVPFAIAECLAVWAFHLRYLARRADDGF